MGNGIRPVSVAERRARLAARHHLAPASRGAASPGGVAGAVADIIGLHGTDPASVHLAAWARTGAARADIEHALYAEGALVRMLGMRRTVFVVPASLMPVVQAACTDQIAERMRRDLSRRVQESAIAADGAAWLGEVAEATMRALAARGSATGAELARDEPRLRAQIVYPGAEGKSYGGPVNVTTRLLTLLSAEGLIVRGRPRGGWTSSQFTWSAAPAQPRPDGRRRPGRAGPPLAAGVRPGRPGRPAVVGRLDGDAGQAGAEPAAMWPRWTWTGWRASCSPPTRRRPPPRNHGPRCCLPSTPPRWAGVSGAGTWAGTRPPCSTGPGTSARRPGGTAGSWAAGRTARTARSPSGCSRTRRQASAALAAEAERLREWIGADPKIRITPRFRTPLERELAG